VTVNRGDSRQRSNREFDTIGRATIGGKLADLVVLDGEVFTCDETRIKAPRRKTT
jgi:predicted amidohydrolase YtcJ